MDLRDKLIALRALAPGLNETTQQMGAIVAAVEKMLDAELSLGIPAETAEFDCKRLVDDEEGRPVGAVQFLAYGRVNGKFCIHVVEAVESVLGMDNGVWRRLSTERTPWASCPRDLKLRSFVRLPELLETIADRAKGLADEADRAIETVKGFLAAMHTP